MPAQTRTRSSAGVGTMEDSTAGAGTAGKTRKCAPRPKLSAMLPFVLGCLAPVPIFIAAMDKVPGEKAPRYPVLYEFNKLFKLCGGSLPPPPPPAVAAFARAGPAAGRNIAAMTPDRACRAWQGSFSRCCWSRRAWRSSAYWVQRHLGPPPTCESIARRSRERQMRAHHTHAAAVRPVRAHWSDVRHGARQPGGCMCARSVHQYGVFL